MKRSIPIPFAHGELRLDIQVTNPDDLPGCEPCLDHAVGMLLERTRCVICQINGSVRDGEHHDRQLQIPITTTFESNGQSIAITATVSTTAHVDETRVIDALGMLTHDLGEIADALHPHIDKDDPFADLFGEGALVIDLSDLLGANSVSAQLASVFGRPGSGDAFIEEMRANRPGFPLGDLLRGASAMRDRLIRRETERRPEKASVDGLRTSQPSGTEPSDDDTPAARTESIEDIASSFGYTGRDEFTTVVFALAFMEQGADFLSSFFDRNKVHPRQMNAFVLSHLIEEAQIGTKLHDVTALLDGRQVVSV